jgi:hypothetical protein
MRGCSCSCGLRGLGETASRSVGCSLVRVAYRTVRVLNCLYVCISVWRLDRNSSSGGSPSSVPAARWRHVHLSALLNHRPLDISSYLTRAPSPQLQHHPQQQPEPHQAVAMSHKFSEYLLAKYVSLAELARCGEASRASLGFLFRLSCASSHGSGTLKRGSCCATATSLHTPMTLYA